MNVHRPVLAGLGLLTVTGLLQAQVPARPYPQFPAPMAESTRIHARMPTGEVPGWHGTVSGVLPVVVDVFVPESCRGRDTLDLLMHFHGAPYVVHHAADSAGTPLAVVTVNLGVGSSAYNGPFEDSTMFPRLWAAVVDTISADRPRLVVRRTVLSGFSAGYGAVRRILSQEANRARVDAVVLLDGIHASYVPERTLLADGGAIDSMHLAAFLRLAQESSSGASRKNFLITHSEIFPGTFVSTTEATDWLLARLGMSREPVLRWGPLGMQQLSEARRGGFAVLGFAGNAAQDHVDHLHALGHFLRMLGLPQ